MGLMIILFGAISVHGIDHHQGDHHHCDHQAGSELRSIGLAGGPPQQHLASGAAYQAKFNITVVTIMMMIIMMITIMLKVEIAHVVQPQDQVKSF